MTEEKNTVAKKRRAKEEYLRRKLTLLEIEKNNYSKLYLLRSNEKWYKLFGHSALFLSKYLTNRVGKTYTLHFDNDYGVRDKNGSISVPADKIEEFKLRMQYAKINLVREWGYGLEFEIGEKLSEEDVVNLEAEDEYITAKANELVLPHAIMPELRAQVREMTRQIHTLISNQSKLSKTAFLFDMEKAAVKMDKTVIAMGRGMIEIDEALEKLLNGAENMYEYIAVVADLELVPPKKYYDTVKKIRLVEDQVKREIKKQAIRKVENATSKERTKRKTAKRTKGDGEKSASLSAAKEEKSK